jgi:hypothetical protein
MQTSMNKLYPLFICLLFSLTVIQAQESSTQSRSIDETIEDILITSNRYQDYKVIKRARIDRLREEIADSLKQYKNTIGSLEAGIDEREATITELQQSLRSIEADLNESRKKEVGIYLFGWQLKKTSYNYIMLGVIGLLLILLLTFVTKYRSSNAQTRTAREKLADIEAEFETHRQRSLEREQQIRRKLQDELNKNKKPGKK